MAASIARGGGLGLLLLLSLSDEYPFVAAERSQGPPSEQHLKRGTIGSAIDYEDFREIYRRSPELARRRQPYAGVDYLVQPHRAELMQGQAVFTYRAEARVLVHNFFCWQLAGTAQMPWSCESRVFVLTGGRPVTERPRSEWPRQTEESGFTLLDAEDEAQLSGDFDTVQPHPSQPLFATIQLGCCGSPSRVAVHDFRGRTLCPADELLIGLSYRAGGPDSPTGVWDKLGVEGGRVYCPDGRRTSIETAVAEDPAALIQSHAAALLAEYRLPAGSDLRGEWKDYRWERGHLPVYAWGDFDGDGADDLAFLLPRRGRETGFGLFCLVSRGAGAFRLVTLEEDPHSLPWSHGLETVAPGRHAALCGKASARLPDCQGQAREVLLEHDGIHLLAFEGAGAYYVWDDRRRAFQRVRAGRVDVP